MKKDKINTFLYVFVSPSACSKEFRATTNINNIEPANIISVYSSPNLLPLELLPSIERFFQKSLNL